MIRFIILVKLNKHKAAWPRGTQLEHYGWETLSHWVSTFLPSLQISDPLEKPPILGRRKNFSRGGGLGAIRIDCSLQFASEWNLELNEKGLWAERGV